jgi:hypothetical protein
MAQVRLTFIRNEVNIINLTFLTSRGLFYYDYFLIKLILLGDRMLGRGRPYCDTLTK